MGNNKTIQYKLGLMRLGISQRKLGDILGFSESYISMLLSGSRKNIIFDNWVKENLDFVFYPPRRRRAK